MMYGVRFGNHHSFDDWGVYINSFSFTSPPANRIKYHVPYRNGALDVTKGLTDYITYDNRTLTFVFTIYDNELSWAEITSKILNDVHGKYLRIVRDSDPDWYWEGYCEVKVPKPDKEIGTIEIDCDVFPYKRKLVETRVTKVLEEGSNEFICVNSRMEVTPIIDVSGECILKWTDRYGNNFSVALHEGENIVPKLIFEEGQNVVYVETTSPGITATIKYTEGVL